MISIIICSISNEFYNQVSANIKATIGVEYELIQIDNNIKNYGICKAYNIGAAQAKSSMLCFMHEDILVKSTNWGKEILDFFEQNEKIGVVGIAGSTFKSIVPSIWAQGLYQTDYLNLIQHYNTGKSLINPDYPSKWNQVKTLDGVLLFCPKKIWEEHPFDEKNFDKFHLYDLDFCTQVGQKYKVYVFTNMLIEHFSSGQLNKEWVEYSLKYADKWKHLLPLGNLSKKQQHDIEWRNRKILFFRMNILGYPPLKIIKVFFSYKFLVNTSFWKVLNFCIKLLAHKMGIIKAPKYY
ncbi:glycosyltransferase [Pedobacter sp. D749]|uniref:glycosyltransferase n=1 Tax=Pedobacter sp. D749 TaxID=2856523 RepID=UPI001C55BF51|nr:glycosyltransferase [Pedobacter sp. D749]QXU42336.1 glycosyltransferase family protein [Pedobacter sp. D749]